MPKPPLTPDQLFARFDALGITYRTYSHPPVFTVAEAAALRGTLPGGHCKSLFLKDKNKHLVQQFGVAERKPRCAKPVGKPLQIDPPVLQRHREPQSACVRPGSVTPFAIVNDTAHQVAVLLDKQMLSHDPLNICLKTTVPPRWHRRICCTLSRHAATSRGSSILTRSPNRNRPGDWVREGAGE